MKRPADLSALLVAIVGSACARTSMDAVGGSGNDQQATGAAARAAGGSISGAGSGGSATSAAGGALSGVVATGGRFRATGSAISDTGGSLMATGGSPPSTGDTHPGAGGALAGAVSSSSPPIASGGQSQTGGTYAGGGAGGLTSSSSSSAGGSGAGGFPIAQPGLGLTDVLPLLTPSAYNVNCAQVQCAGAVACSNDPACAWEISCLVNDCRVAAGASQTDPSLVERDACLCLGQLETRCNGTTDIQGCLGSSCPASSPATALGGLNGVSCVIACSGTSQCPYHGH
jgi:hypothetical protein